LAGEVGAWGLGEVGRVFVELGRGDYVGGSGWCVVVAIPGVGFSNGEEFGAGVGE
jgi:hypothetical protein